MRRVALAAVLAGTVACGNRDRINAGCIWTGDPPAVLDPANNRHRDHLGTDADLAVDLAIRYADITAGRMASPNWVRQRDECLAKLAATVAARHGISVDGVLGAVGRRSLVFTSSVGVGYLLLFTAFCRMFVRRLFDSWSHQGVAGAVAIVAISLMLTAGATAVGALWTGAAEMIRLGNEHVSGRLRSFPFKPYFSLLFAASLAIFWLLAWRPFRSVLKNVDEPAAGRSLLR